MEGSFTTHTFEELGLRPELIRAASELNFSFMTPVQAEAIPLLLNGADVIGQARTGTGKTAAFGLPILEKTDPDLREVQALILCPTRELAVQVANDIRSYAAFLSGVKTLPVYGGQDIARQISGLKGTQIVVGTPGRIMDHLRRHTLKLDHVSTVILDEADEMLDMGFIEDMETILGSIPQQHQTCLFSATMPQAIRDLAGKFLSSPVMVQITGEELTVPGIDQFYYSVKREYKVQALVRLITYYNYKKCMIFCNMKSTVDTLVSELQKEGVMAEALHGDLSQFLRDAAMKRFRENGQCVLVATDIAARGIDVGDVEAVFNYDIPQEAEYYIHRIGRTGRAGRAGVSHTLVGSREFHSLRFIESICHRPMTERTVPTPEEIFRARQLSALREALSRIRETGNSADQESRETGMNDSLLCVHSFCLENAISPEELAAAFLLLKTGAMAESLEIDLPDRNTKRKAGNRNREERRRPFPQRQDSARCEEKIRETSSANRSPKPDFSLFQRVDKDKLPYDAKAQEKELRKYRKKLKEENYKWGNFDVIAEEYRSEEKKKHRDKSCPTKSDRKENSSRSRRILAAAIKDVNARGQAKPAKKRKARS